jgi:hypothetical protein
VSRFNARGFKVAACTSAAIAAVWLFLTGLRLLIETFGMGGFLVVVGAVWFLSLWYAASRITA